MSWYDNSALGEDTGPTREEIEETVLDFDDANNGMSATFTTYPGSEYRIQVFADIPGLGSRECIADFDRLYEFKDWVQRQEFAAERELVSA